MATDTDVATRQLGALLAPHGLSLQASHVVPTGSLAEWMPVTGGTRIEVTSGNLGAECATLTNSGNGGTDTTS